MSIARAIFGQKTREISNSADVNQMRIGHVLTDAVVSPASAT